MLAIVSQPGIHCPTCNMPWSLWIIALFQDEPANFEKSLAGFWALSVDSLVLHPKLFHPWHCRMDKPGIGSSEPSQFCREKCVAWALEAAENRPAFAAPNKMNSTRCAHKMLHMHDNQAFVLVHTADRLGFSIYPLWQTYSEDLASGRRLSLSKSSITAPGPVKPPPGLLSFKQWWSLRSFLCSWSDEVVWWYFLMTFALQNLARRNWCLTKTFCSEAARPRWSCSGGKVPGSFQQEPQFFFLISLNWLVLIVPIVLIDHLESRGIILTMLTDSSAGKNNRIRSIS